MTISEKHEILRLRRPSFVPLALSFGGGFAQDDVL
jgi:hypothetical protein